MSDRVCKRCKVQHPKTNFTPHGVICYTCKVVARDEREARITSKPEYTAKWLENNRDRWNAYQRAYRLKHKGA